MFGGSRVVLFATSPDTVVESLVAVVKTRERCARSTCHTRSLRVLDTVVECRGVRVNRGEFRIYSKFEVDSRSVCFELLFFWEKRGVLVY